MRENNSTNKNPLELALEAFQKGTEKIETSRIELEEFVDFVIEKQENFSNNEKEFTEKMSQIISLLSNNLELYENITMNLHSNFKNVLSNFQTNFQQSVNSSKLVTINLNDADRTSLQDVDIQFKKYFRLKYFHLGINALLLIIVGVSGYFTTLFYETSVQTKTEARQEFLLQLERNDEIIVKQVIWNAQVNERTMLKDWSKSNPNDSRSYESFRNGIISANSKVQLFENLQNDNIVGK